MNPKKLKDRMSHDPKLDAFNSKFGRKLGDDYLLDIMREAEKEVLTDTMARVKERDVTLSSGARAVNLEDDFLMPVSIRWKTSNDDALAEGIPVQIVTEDRLL